MSIENEKWYDLNCLPEPITGAQVSALNEMVNSDGWKVFARMKDIEARSSACTVLNPSSPLDKCEAGRALWYAQCLDVTFGETFKAELAEAVPQTAEELNFRGDVIVSMPIPSKAEFDIFNKTDKQ